MSTPPEYPNTGDQLRDIWQRFMGLKRRWKLLILFGPLLFAMLTLVVSLAAGSARPDANRRLQLNGVSVTVADYSHFLSPSDCPPADEPVTAAVQQTRSQLLQTLGREGSTDREVKQALDDDLPSIVVDQHATGVQEDIDYANGLVTSYCASHH